MLIMRFQQIIIIQLKEGITDDALVIINYKEYIVPIVAVNGIF
jgi:hypothetical protein